MLPKRSRHPLAFLVPAGQGACPSRDGVGMTRAEEGGRKYDVAVRYGSDMTSPSKRDRIVAARLKLKSRYEHEVGQRGSPTEPVLGNGLTNRHGMPAVPPGQTVTEKWPVLDLGEQPRIARTAWSLTVDGAVEQPVTLRWDDFMALDQIEDVSDFHCVTTWSKLDISWVGVRLVDVLALAGPLPEACHVMCHAYDGYSTNVSLFECLKPDVLLVHTASGEPLPIEHGGPVRMITPQLYAWKGAKWVSRIEVLLEERLGFWEQRGYSSTALPWRDDRYS